MGLELTERASQLCFKSVSILLSSSIAYPLSSRIPCLLLFGLLAPHALAASWLSLDERKRTFGTFVVYPLLCLLPLPRKCCRRFYHLSTTRSPRDRSRAYVTCSAPHSTRFGSSSDCAPRVPLLRAFAGVVSWVKVIWHAQARYSLLLL